MCTIAIDYDGTISSNFEQAKEALDILHEQGHYIVIWSSRNNTRQHGINRDSLMAEMKNCLDQHLIYYDEIDYGGCGKFHAQVYIDDKCWRFESNWKEIINRIY